LFRIDFSMYKNNKILLLLLLSCPGANLFSQELSHQVLVPIAGVTSTGSVNYSQTIGETAVEIFTSLDFVLTQGFQQPGMKLTNETPPPGTGVNIYPNPVADYLTFELFGDAARTFRIDILNMTGTVVYTKNIKFTDKFWYKEPVYVDFLVMGLYLIRITSEDRIINRTFKIEKM
jgi:hypothetical protein